MNILDINPTQILQQRIASAMGLDKYRYIMKTVREVDVRENVGDGIMNNSDNPKNGVMFQKWLGEFCDHISFLLRI